MNEVVSSEPDCKPCISQALQVDPERRSSAKDLFDQLRLILYLPPFHRPLPSLKTGQISMRGVAV